MFNFFRCFKIFTAGESKKCIYLENFNSPASNEYATSRSATYEATGVPVPETGGKIRGIAHKPQKFLHSVYGLIVWTKFQPCFESHQQGVLHFATI